MSTEPRAWTGKSPRLVLVISSLGAGGAERSLTELAGFLVARGWGVTLATFDDDSSNDFYPVDRRIRRARLGNPRPGGSAIARLLANRRRCRSLRTLFQNERPDAVLAFIETNNVLSILAGRGMALPVVVAERIDPAVNDTVPLPWRLARRLFYRHAAAVVAQTDAAAAWLRNRCRTAVQVIPNALRSLPTLLVSREPLVLSIGRLVPQKGFDVLLRSFARVHEAFPAWRLAIVGEGPQGEALQSLVRELRIAEKVELFGRSPDIERWYARASIVAQASRFEGFPNVLLEAMGMGAAVVATDCRSGPRELIVDGDNGLLVAVGDEVALADALQRLMADGSLRERLGARALAVRERFAAPHVHAQWETLLTEMTAAGST
jgi:GalNAc-alpha-(1->4)-GalNAc-alpha-(1->3)-diNAcBac-PP-undecaprenol alpha-1,4-N-acetyl-D-galactosaminyltransferase